jgi:Zn-dependent protease
MPLIVALIIFELVAMVLAICIHDAAQAWTANKLGDPTARMLGRITMNPARHFDLFGMAIWPLLYIYFSPLVLGWGKPVPMTWRNFRQKNGEMLATLAGPAAQVLAAIVAVILLLVLKHTVALGAPSLQIAAWLTERAPLSAEGLPAIFPLFLFLYMCILMNALLAVFNLVPLPFLDGGKILVHFLPYNAAKTYEQYSMWFMIGFFFLGYRLILIFFAPLMAIFNTLLGVR